MSLTAAKKASLGTASFSLFALSSWLFVVGDKLSALPLLLFYAALMVHTYFSVRLFSSLVPRENILQIFFDALLFLINTGMAFSFGNPLLFLFLNLLLFIVAPLKYSFLLGLVNQPKLLKRKIIVDLAGALAAALSLGGFLAGYEPQAAWGLAIVFYLASIFLFFVRPLYALDKN